MKILPYLLLLCSLLPALPAHAQQDSYAPLSSTRKKIKTSTDIVALALPTAALIGTLCERDWQGLIQGVETAGAAAVITLAMKYGIKEWRPDMSDTHSFPSGHSVVSFATAAYLQRRYGWAFGGPAYALSCYVAWGRVFARQHHVWDVVAGAALGAASAYFFTTPFARKHDLSIAPVSDGTSIGITSSFSF